MGSQPNGRRVPQERWSRMAEQAPRTSNALSESMDVYPINMLPPDEQAVARLLGMGAIDAEVCRGLGLTTVTIAAIVERIGLRLFDAYSGSPER